MSDNMKWPEKNENIEQAETELGCDSPELNQMIGWNACLEECKRLNCEHVSGGLGACPKCMTPYKVINQPAAQCAKHTSPFTTTGGTMCPNCHKFIDNKSELRLAPLDYDTVHDLLWKLFREDTKHAANKRHAELGAKAICAKFAQPKEVKVSVEEIEREIDKHRTMVNGQSYYNTTITELIFKLCLKK